jgi:hypothetical protein
MARFREEIRVGRIRPTGEEGEVPEGLNPK